MATTGGSSRDATARRRRILERGSDRLALITGRLQSIPSSSPSDQLPASDGNMGFASNVETAHHDDVGNEVKPSMHTEASEIQSFPIRLAADETPQISTSERPELESNLNETIIPNQISTSEKPASQTYLKKTFSPNQLRRSITSSQDTRTMCSVIVAMLVALSHVGFSILGHQILKSVLLSRPLYLLILTNTTMVIAHLISKTLEKNYVGSSSDPISRALDWGMLFVSGSSALFMDCSIYLVVVVCGVSFLKNLSIGLRI